MTRANSLALGRLQQPADSSSLSEQSQQEEKGSKRQDSFRANAQNSSKDSQSRVSERTRKQARLKPEPHKRAPKSSNSLTPQLRASALCTTGSGPGPKPELPSQRNIVKQSTAVLDKERKPSRPAKASTSISNRRPQRESLVSLLRNQMAVDLSDVTSLEICRPPRLPSLPSQPQAEEGNPLSNPLNSQGITDKHAQKSADSAPQFLLADQLQKVKLHKGSVLDFNGLGLTDSDVSFYAESIAEAKSVRLLKLARNQLTDEGLRQLCGALRASNVEHLDLSGNVLSREGLLQCINLLKGSKLKSLDARSSQLDPKDRPKVASEFDSANIRLSM